jgi:hypothetical protein
MRGYISQMADGGAEWPTTYVVVDTSPERWKATLELTGLIDILDGREGGLRRIPHQWDGEDLVVELGPVHVRGDRQGWRTLARRVLGAAGSSADLYDVPAARPWGGPSVTIPVDQVGVLDDQGAPRADEPETTSVDSILAAAGGFSEEEFGQLFGFGWQPVEPTAVSTPPVYLWGNPAQLGAQTSEDGRLQLGQPRGSWPEPGELHMELVEPTVVDSSQPRPMIETFVADLLRRRRRTFTWCRYCGDPLAPEQRLERNVCHGCGTSVLGVVY